MCTAELVAILRIVEIGSPGIVAQYRFTKPTLKVACYRFESAGIGHGQYRKFRCLIGPDPVFVSVHFGPCLVTADYRALGKGRHNSDRLAENLAEKVNHLTSDQHTDHTINGQRVS